jgi:hypothetical protein
VITFVKNEGNNLGTMATTLQSIIDYKLFNLFWVYKGTYFGHAMFKSCQYVLNDDKVSMGLILVSMKDVQTCLQKKIWERMHEWEKTHIQNGMWHQKLKTNQ